MIANYEEARVKLTIAQLKKLNPAAKSTVEATLRILRKTFKEKEFKQMEFFVFWLGKSVK